MMEDNNIELNEIKDTSPIGSTAQKQDKKGDLWLILIALLLAGLLAVNLLQFFAQKDQQALAAIRAQTYSERVDEALQTYKTNQIRLANLVNDYEEAVYEDENVTNIYQQQLKAAEYNFITLQYIASQNQEIILLLTSLP
jgi:hypothetical protein